MIVEFIFVLLFFTNAEKTRHEQLLEDKKGWFTNLGNMWYTIMNAIKRPKRVVNVDEIEFNFVLSGSFTDGIVPWIINEHTGVKELFLVVGEYFVHTISVLLPSVLIFGFTLLLFIVWGIYQCFAPQYNPKDEFKICVRCRKPSKAGKYSIFARICVLILSAFMLFFVICAFVAAIYLNTDIKGVFKGATGAIDFFVDAIDRLNVVNNVSVSFLDLTTISGETIEINLYNRLLEYTTVIDKYVSSCNLIMETLRYVNQTSKFPGFTNDRPYDVEGTVEALKTRACVSNLTCTDDSLAYLCPTDPDQLVSVKLDDLRQYAHALGEIGKQYVEAQEAREGFKNYTEEGSQDVTTRGYLRDNFTLGEVPECITVNNDTELKDERTVAKGEVERYIAAIESYARNKNSMLASNTHFLCSSYPPFNSSETPVDKVPVYESVDCTSPSQDRYVLACQVQNVLNAQKDVDDTTDLIAVAGDIHDNYPDASSALATLKDVMEGLDDITLAMDGLFYETRYTLWRGANFLRGLNDFVDDYLQVYNSYGNVIFYGTCGLLGVYMLLVLVGAFCTLFCTDDSILCCAQLFHTIFVLLFGLIAVVFSFLAMASMDVWKDLYKEPDLVKFHPLLDFLVDMTKPVNETEAEAEAETGGVRDTRMERAMLGAAADGGSSSSHIHRLSSFMEPSTPFLIGLKESSKSSSGSGSGSFNSFELPQGLVSRVQKINERLMRRAKRWRVLSPSSSSYSSSSSSFTNLPRKGRLSNEFKPPSYDEYLPFADLNGSEIGEYYLKGGNGDNPLNKEFVEKMIRMFSDKLGEVKDASNFFGQNNAGEGLEGIIEENVAKCETSIEKFNETVQDIIKPDSVTPMIDNLMSPILNEFSHTITTFWLFSVLNMILYIPLMFLLMCGRDLWRKRKKVKRRKVLRKVEPLPLDKTLEGSIISDPVKDFAAVPMRESVGMPPSKPKRRVKKARKGGPNGPGGPGGPGGVRKKKREGI